jgi:hypothetical protein
MKQRTPLLILALILTIVSTTAVASASDATSSDERGPKPGMMRPFAPKTERPGETRENMEEKRAEFKSRFDEFRKDKIERMIEIMKTRFLAAIERLRGIALRIETRIENLATQTDVDTDEARQHLKDARAHLDAAEDLLEDINASSTDLFANDATPGQRFGALRALFAEAKTEIKAARESLVLALRATGGLLKGTSERPEVPKNN